MNTYLTGDIERVMPDLLLVTKIITKTNIYLSQHYKIYYMLHNIYLGHNCIQHVHLGRYIVGDVVGNFVLLRRRVSGAVKRNFRPYNRRYTSPNEHFEYGYPHSNALFDIYSSKAQYFAPK